MLEAHHQPVAADEPRAQVYFDPGLVQPWGFNHAEAGRSFREAWHDADVTLASSARVR